MSLPQDIKYKYSRLNIFEKIIVINIVVFIIGKIASLVYPSDSNIVLKWFVFPVEFKKYILQPWSILTYAFVHYDFLHLLFNMLWLYVVGRMFVNLFNTKLALNVYLLGAIFGALLFMLGYNVFPNFFNQGVFLVGASASIRALIIFLCTYMPKMEVNIFTFKIKLWYLGIALVFLDILGLFGLNPGGNIAHIGGALLGYYYATQLAKAKDIGKGFELFMDGIASWFKVSSKKTKLKTVHKKKSKVGGYTKDDFSEFNKQKQIDIILDKIGKSGYNSLTKEEKEFLFKAGKR